MQGDCHENEHGFAVVYPNVGVGAGAAGTLGKNAAAFYVEHLGFKGRLERTSTGA